MSGRNLVYPAAACHSHDIIHVEFFICCQPRYPGFIGFLEFKLGIKLETRWLFLETAKSRTVDCIELNNFMFHSIQTNSPGILFGLLNEIQKIRKLIVDRRENGTVPAARLNSTQWHVTPKIRLCAKTFSALRAVADQSSLRRTDDSTD